MRSDEIADNPLHLRGGQAEDGKWRAEILLGGRIATRLPKGPDVPQDHLPRLIVEYEIDEVVFAYSDVDYPYVMHRASLANALGADFALLGTRDTMLKANVPVIAVTAVRTGSGKSQTTRRLAQILMAHGKKVVVVRHPMPYGELAEQAVERFAK